jgi:hypothetical protein
MIAAAQMAHHPKESLPTIRLQDVLSACDLSFN